MRQKTEVKKEYYMIKPFLTSNKDSGGYYLGSRMQLACYTPNLFKYLIVSKKRQTFSH